MSEYEREPSPEPLFDTCDNCEKKYQITNKNALAYHFDKQPECDFIVCACPNCKQPVRIYIGSDSLEQARTNEIDIEVQTYADDETYELWCGLNGIELPKTYKLTDRHEALIHKFGETLLNIPDSLFWDNIEGDTGKPFTQRWV